MNLLYIFGIFFLFSIFGASLSAPTPEDESKTPTTGENGVDLDSRFSLDEAKTAITHGAKKVQAGVYKAATAVKDGVNCGYEYLKEKLGGGKKIDPKYAGLDHQIDVRIDDTKSSITKREAGNSLIDELPNEKSVKNSGRRKDIQSIKSPSKRTAGRNILLVPLKNPNCLAFIKGRCRTTI